MEIERKVKGGLYEYKAMLDNYHLLNIDDIFPFNIDSEDPQSQKDKLYTELKDLKRKKYSNLILFKKNTVKNIDKEINSIEKKNINTRKNNQNIKCITRKIKINNR